MTRKLKKQGMAEIVPSCETLWKFYPFKQQADSLLHLAKLTSHKGLVAIFKSKIFSDFTLTTHHDSVPLKKSSITLNADQSIIEFHQFSTSYK